MKKKPNIVFILTDDQGAWAMNCSGNKDIKTPNLDKIAEDGVRFENFFCTSPVCSPARASILTGRMPSQHGVHDWIRSGNLNKDDLEDKKDDPYFKNENKSIQYLDGMLTYTDILANEGYTCALAGKWHLGDSLNPQHGFSRWYTIGRGGCLYYKPDIVEDGKIVYDERYVTDLITDKAIEYIDEFSKKDSPYYISVHYTAPHDPWDEEQHPKEYVDLYRNCKFEATPDLPVHPWQIDSAPYGTGDIRKSLLRGYYAAVSAMDAAVGRIVKRLEDLGELENTIIFFMADNGMNMGHHGIWGKGNGTFPFNMYDTAVKIPFLVWWKNNIPKNKVIKTMHSQYDFIHTLIELTDINVELPKNLPGKSFKGNIFGKKGNEGELVVFDEYGPNRMIRTDEWKLIHRFPYGPDELYHLTEDPDEYNNLIDNKEYENIICNLKDRMTKWFNQYVDPKLDGTKEAVTGYGQLRKAGYYSEGKETYSKAAK